MASQTAPEAVIVAGGFGTRLRPLTDRRPKHLLEVGGVPFLEHQLARLARSGVVHVVLATSYQADLFEPVLGDGRRFGLRLTYVREEVPLGTGGAIRNVADALDPDPDGVVVVLNGDVLSGHDLGAQLADFARPRGGELPEVSLHLVEVADPRAFGCVPTDGRGRVTAFLEKSPDPVTHQVNAGCYLFRRGALETIPTGREVSVERETFPALLAEDRQVVGYVESSYWRDVGTPEALVEASRDLVLGRFDSPAVPAPSARTGDAWLLGAEVADGARVDDGACLSARVRVAGGARVSGSVLMPGAEVGSGAVVERSVLGPGARVGERGVVRRATLGDGAQVGEGAVVAPGSRIGCEAHIAAGSGESV